jgi:hypothetical protein
LAKKFVIPAGKRGELLGSTKPMQARQCFAGLRQNAVVEDIDLSVATMQ